MEVANGPRGEPESARHVDSPVVLLSQVALGSNQTARERALELDVELPPALDTWFAKATAHSPRHRFETASELVEALAEVLCIPLPSSPTKQLAIADSVVGGGPPTPKLETPGTCAALSTNRASTAHPKPRRLVPIAISLLAAAGIAVAVLVVPRLVARAPAQAPVVESGFPSGEPLARPDASSPVVVLPPEPVASDLPLEPAAPVAAAPPRASPKPEATTPKYLQTEVKNRMRELRAQLPVDDQSLLVLRIDKGLSWNELASIFSSQGEALSDTNRRRWATRLRQRFVSVKARLRALAEAEGLI